MGYDLDFKTSTGETIDSRIKIEEEFIQKAQNEDVTCKSLESSGIPKNVINDKVCEKFKYLYNSLCTGESNDCNDNDYAFLNFWLNNILYSIQKSDQIDAKFYYQKLKENDKNFDKKDNLKDRISKIDNDVLDNMNIMYELYRIYRNIYDGRKVVCLERTGCLKFYNKFVEEYKKGLVKCPNYETNFCKELGLFKIILTQNKVNLLSSGIFKLSDPLDLPTYAEVAKELGINDGKEITLMIFSIVGPIFGIITLWIYLKKFTPFGKWVNTITGQGKRNNSTIDKKTKHILFDSLYTEESDAKSGKYKVPYNSVGNY